MHRAVLVVSASLLLVLGLRLAPRRPAVPEVRVNGSQYCIIRRRETYEELIGLDKIPAWLA